MDINKLSGFLISFCENILVGVGHISSEKTKMWNREPVVPVYVNTFLYKHILIVQFKQTS